MNIWGSTVVNWADNVLKNMSADDCLNMINISFADFVKKNSFNKPNTDNAYYVEKSERIMKLHENSQMMIEKKDARNLQLGERKY